MTNIYQFPARDGHSEAVTVIDGAADSRIAEAISEQMSDADKQGAVDRLLWLLNFDLPCTDPDLLHAAETDATEDPSLLIWLHQPTPSAFLERFAVDDWSSYELYEATGGDRWARQVVERARSLIDQGSAGVAIWQRGRCAAN